MIDWYKYNKKILYPGKELIQETLHHNTRVGKLTHKIPMQQHHKIRNPMLSRYQLQEGYATNNIFYKLPSFEGYNYAQGLSGIDLIYQAGYEMNTKSNGPTAMLDFFRAEGVPISLTRNKYKMQKSRTWNKYMRRYWVKDRFIEPHHPEQNSFEQDMKYWKSDMTKFMIEYDVDPKGWFKLMQHTTDVHNHQANKRDEDKPPPLTAEKGETGDITILTTYNFNEDVLYQ